MSFLPISPDFIITINGAPITSINFNVEIEIDLSCSFEPDIFKIKIFNIDQITQILIVKGAIVTISLGYKIGIKSNVITGIITNIKNYNDCNDSVMEIYGIDLIIYMLKQQTINLSINIPKDVIEIIREVAIRCGVILSADSVPSGVILNSYSIYNKKAYTIIKELAKRIEFNVTSKLSQLYITRSIISSITAAVITDNMGYTFYKSSGVKQNESESISGYKFEGNGLSTLIPMKIVSVNSVKQFIFSSFIIESVTHKYNRSGYICYGNLIEVSNNPDSINILSNDFKSLSSIISNKIDERISEQPTLDTGIVEQVFPSDRLITAKIGINPSNNKSILNKSIESSISLTDKVFVNKKPMMSSFVGNGFGIINPIYQNTRCVLGFNRFDSQDINVLGVLWDKNWTIPAHDNGDYMIHHKNHSKEVHKESGDKIEQYKSLKIQIGNSGLTVSKPSATDDGKLIITFDDNSELSYKAGDGWNLNTTGNVVVNGASIKLGSGASLGGARLNDPVVLDPSLLTWITTHTHPTAAPGPPSPALPVFTGTDAGTIKSASSKVKLE
jgi:hypothetical protein